MISQERRNHDFPDIMRSLSSIGPALSLKAGNSVRFSPTLSRVSRPPLLSCFLLASLFLISCRDATIAEPENLEVKVIDSLPHDNQAFTQGFLFHEGKLYESTGQYGESTLRRIDPLTGKIIDVRYLSDDYFGEGLTLLGDKLYQLTWKAGKGFIYDQKSLKKIGEFEYEGEGWGLTTNDKHLILSDGTPILRFLDPETFAVVKTVTARDHAGDVPDLNELEFVDGEIFANLWYHDKIARISPESGQVTGIMTLTGLLRPIPSDPDSVLNGIAYDKKEKVFYLTGKRWPKVFRIRLKE